MMTAPTAAKIIEALAHHRFQSDMTQLAQLDAEHADAVRAALSAVSRRARIDLRLLLSTVKSEIAEREARKPPPDPRRYEALLVAQGYQPFRPSPKGARHAFLDDEADEPPRPPPPPSPPPSSGHSFATTSRPTSARRSCAD
jgi:hypothetical protein